MHDLSKPPAHGPITVPGRNPLIVGPATAASLDEWDLSEDVVPRPDQAYLVGRYCHGGLPANRNGFIFRPHELPSAIRYVPHTPIDMLHDHRRIVGTHAAARNNYPGGPPPVPSAAGSQMPYTDTMYTNVLAALWSYYFADEIDLVADAYNNGNAFLSMSCLPETVECDVCAHQAPWNGFSSDTYCEHMQGTNAKWFNNPLFLGGGVIIPPVKPGWGRADVTQLASFLDHDPRVSDTVYAQLAATAGTATDSQLEQMTALLISRSFDRDPAIAAQAVRAVNVLAGRNLEYNAETDLDIDLVPTAAVADAAAAAPEINDDRLEALAGGLANGREQSRLDIEQIVDATATADTPAWAALGGEITAGWAELIWKKLVHADINAMAPTVATRQRLAWASDGTALADGSFPIPNLTWLRKAFVAWARVERRNRAKVKKHLMRRAMALQAPPDVLARIEALTLADAEAATAAAGEKGIIVAVVPPPAIAELLAAVGDMPAGEIHVTLAFLGEVDGATGGLPDEEPITLPQLAAAVAAWAAAERPIMAKIGGRGEFTLDQGAVTYASVDAPGLSEMYTRLLAALDNADIPVSDVHGFSPHLTVMTHEPGAGPDELPTGQSWLINEVEVWWGGEHYKASLG